MKKFLLSLSVLLATLSASAGELVEDTYFFTNSGRYKVVELCDVPTISEWNNYSPTFFSVYTAQADDDYNGYQSTNSDAESFVSTAIELEPDAEYVVRFCYYYTEAGASSITDGALNQFDAWTSAQDDFGSRTGTAGTDYIQVASTFNYGANAWTEVSWSFTNTLPAGTDEAPDPWQGSSFLNILFSRVNAGAIVTDVQVAKVTKVYDTRIATKEINWIRTLLEDPNFKTDAVTSDDNYETLIGAMNDLEIAIEEDAPEFDEEESAKQMVGELMELANIVLSIEAPSLNDKLAKIDITSIAGIGRGRAGDYGCFTLEGGNWGHIAGSDALRTAIQKNYANSGTVKIINASFPAGKYFFSAEIRNAHPSASWPCDPLIFDLATDGCTMWVGDKTINLETISGEEFQQFYVIGDVAEGSTFEAGVYWPGVTSGGAAFEIRNVQVRAFGDLEQEIAYKEAWASFIAQWNAAKSARTNLIAKGTDPLFPWANDTISQITSRFDPIYNKYAGVWVDEDGNDIYKSKAADLQLYIDDLNAFGDGTYQGITREDEIAQDWNINWDAYQDKFILVRAYDYANKYIATQNQPIADLKTAIDDAIATRDDAMNSSGDKATYQKAINAAQDVYDDIIKNSTDDRRDADINNIGTQITNLADAKTIFLESAKIPDIINIDFSNQFTPVKDDPDDPELITSYYIEGAVGKMEFPNAAWVNPDINVSTGNDSQFELGFNGVLQDVLRVGGIANSYAVVNLAEDDIPTDDDVLRVQFDLWYGNLGKGYMEVELQNAAGEHVAGFKMDRYNGKVAYNDFNNVTGVYNDPTEATLDGGDGMNLRQWATGAGSSSVSDAGICVDANRTSFDLILDYKAQSLIGNLNNGKNGQHDGGAMPMLNVATNPDLTDNKVAKFVINANSYRAANAGAQGRRCWFDNLVIKKYKSTAEGSAWTIIDAPTSSTTASSVPVAYYTISGVQTTADQKGIVIVKYADGTTKKIFNK